MNANAIINIARVQLGLEDDDYRALLLRVTGKDSLRTMSERQKIAVLLCRPNGSASASGRAAVRLPSHKPYIRLIHALWKKNCARLGVIENGSREALRAFRAHRFVAHGDASVAVDPDLLSYDRGPRRSSRP